MKKTGIISCVLIICALFTYAQDEPPDHPIFSSDAITFDEYPGLSFRISEPYYHYQPWDVDHTQIPSLAYAMEFTNNSEDAISAIYFNAKLYDKEGGILSDGTTAINPFMMEPSSERAMIPEYIGVYATFLTEDMELYEKSGKVEFSIRELKTANLSLSSEPVFSSEWMTFEGFDGLEFQLSEPYVYLDDMSGNEMFAIAMNFKNNSGEPIDRMYFDVQFCDEIGPLLEQEIQEHNRDFIPEPKNFMDPSFPIGYEGIDECFFGRSDMSLFEKFESLNVVLKSVEKGE